MKRLLLPLVLICIVLFYSCGPYGSDYPIRMKVCNHCDETIFVAPSAYINYDTGDDDAVYFSDHKVFFDTLVSTTVKIPAGDSAIYVGGYFDRGTLDDFEDREHSYVDFFVVKESTLTQYSLEEIRSKDINDGIFHFSLNEIERSNYTFIYEKNNDGK